MKITVLDTNGNTVILPRPVSLNISKNTQVPADSLTVVFTCESVVPELAEITVDDDTGKREFTGVVDEQLVFCKNNVNLLRLSCRSMAAVLLDNEAYPGSYILPSIDVIFEKCLKPYGIKGYIGTATPVSTAFTVDKGMTCWQALEDYCSRFLNIYPRINEDGLLDITNKVPDGKIKFSNRGGIFYSGISKSVNRHNQVSHVIARTSINSDYNYIVTNEAAVNRGINHVRYLNCAEMPNEYLSLADKIIANSQKKCVTYTIKSPQNLLNILGCEAEIDSDITGTDDELTVVSVDYYLNGDGEYTEIELCKKQ